MLEEKMGIAACSDETPIQSPRGDAMSIGRHKDQPIIRFEITLDGEGLAAFYMPEENAKNLARMILADGADPA